MKDLADSKMQELVKVGILKEVPVYHKGFGKGNSLTFKGNKVKIKRKVRGEPRWENGVPHGLYFNEFHDVAYDSETNTLVCWAIAL